MNRIAYFVIAIWIIFSIKAHSQGGSTYSIFGIGEVIHNTSAIYDAIGTTAIAIPMDNGINLVNPALWGKLTQTRIRAGYRFNQHLINSNNQLHWQNNGKVHTILYGLSVDTSRGFSIAFGFNPYSTVNYYISKKNTVGIDDYSLSVEELYQGSGGISQIFVGSSFRPAKNLFVGASIFGDFGTINSSIRTLAYGANASSSYIEKTDYFIGAGYRFGIFSEHIPNLGIGAFIETRNKTKLNTEEFYVYELTLDTTFKTESKINLPKSFGLGVSYKFGRTSIGIDFVEMDFAQVNYNLGLRAKFGKEHKISFGISRTRNPDYFAPFWDRITLNAGTYWKSHYLKLDNSKINEYAITFGFDSQIVGSAFLSAAFVFGAKIPELSSLPREYFGRMILEISIGETWFVPFRRD